MNDFTGDLTRLREDAARAARLRSDIGRAAPARSEGTDRSGAVTVILGPDGLPEAIQVHGRWRERLAARSFAAAVGEACQSARRERGAAWARAVDLPDASRRFDRLGPESAEPAPRPDPAPEAFRLHDGGQGPSVLGALAEDTISAFDAAMSAAERAQAEPPRGVGSNRERTVGLTLSPGGRMACQADARWVDRQTGTVLSHALGEALAAARQTLARASNSREAAQRSARTNQLTQEILAALGGMARTNET
jgi:hypothetical protein